MVHPAPCTSLAACLQAATCCEGVVAGLEAAGGALFARDLLASLTAFRVAPLAPGQPPALLPLAADLSGRHLTAALALSPTAVLAGAAPSGLLLVQRDPAAERDRHAAAARRWEEARELGGGGGGGAAPAQQAGQRRRYAPTLSDAVQLDAVAGHDLAGSVVAVAPGLLGVPARRLEELELDGGGLPGTPRSRHSSSASSRPPAPQPAATVVCSNGSVVAARLLTPQQHSLLSQLQRAADATSYADGDGIGPAAKLQVAGPGAAAPGGCIDSSLLAAAFMQPSWHRRLLKAAPANTVHQAAAFLEAAGLL